MNGDVDGIVWKKPVKVFLSNEFKETMIMRNFFLGVLVHTLSPSYLALSQSTYMGIRMGMPIKTKSSVVYRIYVKQYSNRNGIICSKEDVAFKGVLLWGLYLKKSIFYGLAYS